MEIVRASPRRWVSLNLEPLTPEYLTRVIGGLPWIQGASGLDEAQGAANAAGEPDEGHNPRPAWRRLKCEPRVRVKRVEGERKAGVREPIRPSTGRASRISGIRRVVLEVVH